VKGLVALALVVLAGCEASVPRRPTGTAARVVSLAPSVTEIVYALGAGDRLVGVCGQCDFPPDVQRLTRVGGYVVPSVEAVLAVRPDLVVVVPSPGNRESVRAIERAGVPILVTHDRTLADLWAAMRAIAAAVGVPAEGERLVADVSRRLDAVHARVQALPRRRVLIIVGHDPLVAVGGGNMQDELLTLAGGTNVAADAGTVWPTITLELVVARAPEVIVDSAMGTEQSGRALFAGLTTVPAVRSDRVVALRGDTLLRAGPRIPEAAAALAAVIHPEAFPPETGPGASG
jgi:iron complex transport system substrate-binding protein